MLPGELPEPEPSLDHGDETAGTIDVQRALLRVPIEYRAALVLHDVQGRTHEDIAEILEIPIGTVKSRLHRGRVALGRALAGEPEPAPAPSKPSMP
jgi:RNA polymerase sigma-70 factor (ECF subfamily)